MEQTLNDFTVTKKCHDIHLIQFEKISEAMDALLAFASVVSLV